MRERKREKTCDLCHLSADKDPNGVVDGFKNLNLKEIWTLMLLRENVDVKVLCLSVLEWYVYMHMCVHFHLHAHVPAFVCVCGVACSCTCVRVWCASENLKKGVCKPEMEKERKIVWFKKMQKWIKVFVCVLAPTYLHV